MVIFLQSKISKRPDAGGSGHALGFPFPKSPDAMSRLSELTTHECAELMGANVLSVRPRFSELYPSGSIEKTTRRIDDSGMSATVWRAVERPTS